MFYENKLELMSSLKNFKMPSLSHNLSHSPSCLQKLMITTPQMRKSEGCTGTEEKGKELEPDTT